MLEYVVMSKFIGHSSEVTGQPPGALSVKEDADMTAATQGLTGSGVPATQQPGGLAPGFPAPIGAEQYPGFTNWSGVQAPLAFQSPHQAQQIVQQLLAQILPIAQQTIMVQVLGMAVQQLQQQLPQLIAQHVQQQLPALIAQQSMAQQQGMAQQGMPQQAIGQQGMAPFFGQPGLQWAQPNVPQYPSAGLFGQVNRPFSALS